MAEAVRHDNQNTEWALLTAIVNQTAGQPELRENLICFAWHHSDVPEKWLRSLFGFLSKQDLHRIARANELYSEYRCVQCTASLPTEGWGHQKAQKEAVDTVFMTKAGGQVPAQRVHEAFCDACIKQQLNTDEPKGNGLRPCS